MMAVQEITKPVSDSVPKVNNEVAVGEDLEFQKKWWRFERGVWVVLSAFLVLDVLGAFGRGPLANHRIRTGDGAMDMRYERVERFGTPSVIRIRFGPEAVRYGKLTLWVSESLVKSLGNQRVIPQPANSTIGGGGIEYTFAVSSAPMEVEFETRPSKVGSSPLSLRIPGGAHIETSVFVMP